MRVKYFLLGIIFLHILLFSTIAQVQAAESSYSLGMKKGTEIILEVEIFDEDGLEDVFEEYEDAIPEGADEVGMKYKIIVREVDNDAEIDLGILGDYDAFSIEVDIWEWTKGEFAEDPTEEEFEIVWFQDPEDINDAYDKVGGYAYDIIMPFVPIDVVKFLDEIDEWKEDDHEEWKTKDNMVIHDAIFGEENYVEVFTYDPNTGYLVEYKIIDEDGAIVYKYGQSEFIPGYELPIILGIIGIFTIGLIYLMKKRSNLISN
jgi:hypothetical protein